MGNAVLDRLCLLYQQITVPKGDGWRRISGTLKLDHLN